MNYGTASLKLTGRCRERRKLANNTYLIRRERDQIAVRLHSTDILTFFDDGSVRVRDGGWPTVTTKDRMNRFLPDEWRVWTESGNMCLGRGWGHKDARYIPHGATITPEETISGGEPIAELRERIRAERAEAARPRNRARYWVRKARESKPFRGTVADVLAEQNASVRVAKMRCYGIERFFLDADPCVIQELAGYQLLSLPINTWQRVLALKMVCPSTGAVYINTVPPGMRDVPDALDWMFDTKDYLGSVTQQA